MKSGFVAMIGRPNTGKSTLMNHLIGQKISITSEKPQTTRNRIRTVFTDERGQIVFEDTPGMTQARNRLDEYMVDVAEKTIQGADIILWVTEAENYIGASEKKIASDLKTIRKPVVLAINKTDRVLNKTGLSAIMENYGKLFPFKEIVPLSALKDQNTDTLLDVLFGLLPEGPQYFDRDTLTDQPMRDIASERIREQALRLLKEEVPHGIAVTVERYEERQDGLTDIDASIICEKESHKGIIIGKNGSMLKKIGTGARKEIEKLSGTQVNLKLWVKVRKNWREDMIQLKGFGYDGKNLKNT